MHPAVLLAALSSLAGQAQEPATAPQSVCLTNACSEALKDLTKPAAVRDAIVAGDALKVRQLGGSAEDALAAIRESYESGPMRNPYTIRELDRWASPSEGARFAYIDPDGDRTPFNAPGGVPIQWGVERIDARGCRTMVLQLAPGRGTAILNGGCPQ